MDIKQMKTFVSEELKGLKQEHRLLSLRECYSSLLHITVIGTCFKSDWLNFLFQTSVPVNRSWRRKQSKIFRRCWRQNTVRRICSIRSFHSYCWSVGSLVIDVTSVLNFVPAVLEGFEIRESISFIEEHINRQVRLNTNHIFVSCHSHFLYCRGSIWKKHSGYFSGTYVDILFCSCGVRSIYVLQFVGQYFQNAVRYQQAFNNVW